MQWICQNDASSSSSFFFGEIKNCQLSAKAVNKLETKHGSKVSCPAREKQAEKKKGSSRPRRTPFTCSGYSPSLKLLVTLLGWNRLTTGNRENTFNQRTATVETLLGCIHSK